MCRIFLQERVAENAKADTGPETFALSGRVMKREAVFKMFSPYILRSATYTIPKARSIPTGKRASNNNMEKRVGQPESTDS